MKTKHHILIALLTLTAFGCMTLVNKEPAPKSILTLTGTIARDNHDAMADMYVNHVNLGVWYGGGDRRWLCTEVIHAESTSENPKERWYTMRFVYGAGRWMRDADTPNPVANFQGIVWETGPRAVVRDGGE